MEPRDPISVSQLNLYRTCSLKYRFQYVDRLPKVSRPAGLVFGSAVHAALEWLLKAWKAGEQPELEDLLRVFEADWQAQTLEQELILGDDDSVAKLVMKGRELLGLYFAAPRTAVVDAEVPFQIPLVNPTTGEILSRPLRGVIDLVEADDTVVELKTSQKRWALSDLPDNLQLTTYSYAYQMLFGRPPKALKLINLVRTKTPVIERHVTGRELADYERLFHLAREITKGVETGVFFPNRGCWLCRDCEYEQDCREWRGNEEAA